MKRLILTFVFLLLTVQTQANEIDKFIKQSGFEFRSTIGIYVKDLKTDTVLYKRNENKLLNPASSVKALTFGAIALVLGDDYKFETALFKDKNDNYYLKLAADPLLTHTNLESIFKSLKNKKINNIYIDDTIIDKVPYPSGWMGEDSWPNERKITPYIVDNNFVDILIKRSSLSTRIDIIQNDNYKIPIINELELKDKDSSAKQEIKIVKEYGEDLPIINFKGTIVQDEILKLPVPDSELNFKIKVFSALDKNSIVYNKQLQNKKVPADAKKVTSISHSLKEISKEILCNSNNFVTEVVFKAAAAKYINYEHPATYNDAIKMFYEAYNTDVNEIKLADATGVSRHNLVSAKFLAEKLTKLNNKTIIKEELATGGNGTLKDRLLFLKDNLKAKTGTLSGISTICGFLQTKKNKNIVFAIIIQNSTKRKAILKNFEDNLITMFYRKF